MTSVRLFRDPGAGEGGGSSDPTNQTEGVNEDGSLQEGYKLDNLGNVVKAEDPISPPEGGDGAIEGVDADGNLLEGFERLEDGTIQRIESGDEPPELTPEEEASAFYEAVTAITGESYQVEYGDIDPISAEGVALRDKAVKEAGMSEFENHLKETLPKAYAYFLHLQSGGGDDEFFQRTTPTLPTRVEFEADTDKQAATVLKDLTDKGVDRDIAQATVDKFIKDNVLKDKALKVYDSTLEAQQKHLSDIDAFNKKKQEEFNASVNNLLSSVDTAIKNDMKLLIPETKQPEFAKFVQEHIRFDDGKFFFAQEIGNDLPKLLEQLYFKYNNGDLKSLVEKQARSITTQRLRTAVNKDKKTQNNAGSGGQSSSGHVPLSSIQFH
jgi:hypothetical protein